MLREKKALVRALERAVQWLSVPQAAGAIAPAPAYSCEQGFGTVEGDSVVLVLRPALAVVEFRLLAADPAVYTEAAVDELRAIADGVGDVTKSWHGAGTPAFVCRLAAPVHPTLQDACTTARESLRCATCPGGAWTPAQCTCEFRAERHARFVAPEGWVPYSLQ